MLKSLKKRAVVASTLFAVAACSSAPRETDPRLSQPLPPPLETRTGAPLPSPSGFDSGIQGVVVRGVAFATSGDGRYPQNSRLTVRVYDAAGGNANAWIAEQNFTRSGGLPWPYELRIGAAKLSGITSPALAARIEGPDGRLVYQSQGNVPLVAGVSEDIPMVRVTGGGVAAISEQVPGEYNDAPLQRGVQSTDGIPDFRSSYGSPSYNTPAYPGQSYEPTTLSGPPSNTIF